ncbi:MAG: DUF3090 family protein [Acidimicrobiales bacterium]
MSNSFDLPSVHHLTVGTVGEPGHRTFYLQARQDDQLVTLKIEKQQVRVLSERLLELVKESVAIAPPAPELIEPVLAEWPVGALRILDDRDSNQIILMAEEIVELDEEGDAVDTGGLARFGASRAQIAAMARRGMELVEAGRPLCALCGFPLDPEGHACPRMNGHRSPTL